jgi:hypothetical protein
LDGDGKLDIIVSIFYSMVAINYVVLRKQEYGQASLNFRYSTHLLMVRRLYQIILLIADFNNDGPT